jgi:hypothetical protein
MADLFESVLGAVFVDSGYDYSVVLSVCANLADSIWCTVTPVPELEPTRELRERLENITSLSWDRVGCAVIANGFVLSSMKQNMQNWHRIVAWKSCQMMKAMPELLELLKLSKQPVAVEAKEEEGEKEQEQVQQQDNGVIPMDIVNE